MTKRRKIPGDTLKEIRTAMRALRRAEQSILMRERIEKRSAAGARERFAAAQDEATHHNGNDPLAL